MLLICCLVYVCFFVVIKFFVVVIIVRNVFLFFIYSSSFSVSMVNVIWLLVCVLIVCVSVGVCSVFDSFLVFCSWWKFMLCLLVSRCR